MHFFGTGCSNLGKRGRANIREMYLALLAYETLLKPYLTVQFG